MPPPRKGTKCAPDNEAQALALLRQRPLDATAPANPDGDGKSDILWRDSVSGMGVIWQMNGSTVAAAFGIGG